jgi:hypothetical protein
MEKDLDKNEKNGRRTQKKEDDLNKILKNGRRPHFFSKTEILC